MPPLPALYVPSFVSAAVTVPETESAFTVSPSARSSTPATPPTPRAAVIVPSSVTFTVVSPSTVTLRRLPSLRPQTAPAPIRADDRIPTAASFRRRLSIVPWFSPNRPRYCAPDATEVASSRRFVIVLPPEKADTMRPSALPAPSSVCPARRDEMVGKPTSRPVCTPSRSAPAG